MLPGKRLTRAPSPCDFAHLTFYRYLSEPIGLREHYIDEMNTASATTPTTAALLAIATITTARPAAIKVRRALRRYRF